MVSNRCRILDFFCQFIWFRIEKNPWDVRLQVTQTPTSVSWMENWTYSFVRGVVLNVKPNSFSFSMVMILHLNQGAMVIGLILK